MPISKVEINVYECVWCGYKWTNWYDGKEGNTPKYCSSCKRTTWCNGQVDAISPKESALRRKIKYIVTELYPSEQSIGIFFPANLMDTFFSVKPRPTIIELQYWLRPFGYDTRKRFSTEYNSSSSKLLRQEADKRIEIMTEIIRERLFEDYDPYPQIQTMKEAYIHNQQVIKELSNVNNQSEIAISFRKFQEECFKRLESVDEILKTHPSHKTLRRKVDSVRRTTEILIQEWPSNHYDL